MIQSGDSGPTPPRRRLRHRIPTSLRRHWTWPVALIVFGVVVAVALGSTTVHPYIGGDERVIASEITDNVEGTVDLFDDSADHEFRLTISDQEYSDMVEAYSKNGEKRWVTADVVIDGTLVKDVGVRLKGNSTLMGLRSGGRNGPGGMRPPDGADLPEGFEPPEGMQIPDGMQPPDGMEPPDGMQPPGGDKTGGEQTGGQSRQGMAGGPGGFANLSADDPSSLPLLISFDKNEDGRAYHGMTQLSIRPGSPVLNEAMALSLTAATDQPSQRYGYTVYSVNGGETTTRILLEHPDAGYADSLFDSDGYLFKADASSKFEYVDDDQSSYSEQFKQINSDGNGNLEPIIKFLRWMKDADADEFDEHLADWVDVGSFAKYLATQNLISNMDDMSGPGQNYYLWYDLDSEKISVISWDLNLAMQGNATAGPRDSIGMGMGGMGGGPTAGGTKTAGGRQPGTQQQGGRPDGQKETDSSRRDRSGGGMLGGNALKTRFMASPKFAVMYDAAYWKLFDQTYGDSTATDLLERLATTVPVSDSLSADQLAKDVATMRGWITQRKDALDTARRR